MGYPSWMCQSRRMRTPSPPQCFARRPTQTGTFTSSLTTIHRSKQVRYPVLIQGQNGCAQCPNQSVSPINFIATYRRHEQEKRRTYEQRVREVKRTSFTPLLFAASGRIGKAATAFCRSGTSLTTQQWGGFTQTEFRLAEISSPVSQVTHDFIIDTSIMTCTGSEHVCLLYCIVCNCVVMFESTATYKQATD